MKSKRDTGIKLINRQYITVPTLTTNFKTCVHNITTITISSDASLEESETLGYNNTNLFYVSESLVP